MPIAFAPVAGPRSKAVAILPVERADDEKRLFYEIDAGVEWPWMRLRNDQRVEDGSG